MPVVQLNEISLIFQTTAVLDRIEFSVDENEYVVVLGASGCGKTSLLRLIAGLITPHTGTILIDGKNVRNIAPRNRNVALVPQHAGLYPHLPISKSIGMGIRERLPVAERNLRIRQSAKLVEMESFLDRFPDQLSGGQLRRAAVAKTIASRARVRLLDEPLSAIDANLRYQIEDDLRSMHRQIPGVTIHVTHDAAEAMRIADRIAVIDAGTVVQFDTPQALRSAPCTPAVASLLGRSTFVTHLMHKTERGWRSLKGIEITGPRAPLGATAILGYYQQDLVAQQQLCDSRRDTLENATANPADSIREPSRTGSVDPELASEWIDPMYGHSVRQQDLRWFINPIPQK